VEWDEFGKFASQLVRWTQRKTLRQHVWMNVTVQDGKSHVTVDLYDDHDEFVNNAQLTGTVSLSGKASTPFGLEQTAPGRYKGNFALQGTGEYFITVAGLDGQGESIEPHTRAFAVPYSAEYMPRPQDLRLLRKLAEITGGQLLHLTDGAETITELFQVASDGHRPPRSIWYVLILAALILYFLDIVARKLPPMDQWLGRWGWHWSRGRPGMRRAGVGDGVGAAPGLGDAVASGGMPPGELYVARLRGRPVRGESDRRVRR
jgi:hypothetical protein